MNIIETTDVYDFQYGNAYIFANFFDLSLNKKAIKVMD